MSIEKIPGLFYEILVRGRHSLDPQNPDAKLGDYQAAHYIEGEAIVDTDTGQVIQYKQGPALPIDRDKIADYLGERFVTFEANYRDLEQRMVATTAAAEEALAQRDQVIGERDAEIARLRERLSAVAAAVAE